MKEKERGYKKFAPPTEFIRFKPKTIEKVSESVMMEEVGDGDEPIPYPAPNPSSVVGLSDGLVLEKAASFMAKTKKVRSNIYGELTMKDAEEICDVESNVSHPNSDAEDIDIIRNTLVIERVAERMRIMVIVRDNENINENVISLIQCNGDPLGCYAYDSQHDGYYVNCAYHYDLGAIPVAYRVSNQGIKDNSNIMALPDEIIEKYLTPNQRNMMKTIRERYATPRFAITYMQSISF
jgi:hypothetical protein